MKKSIFAAGVCCIALAMTSCKSHESAYMAAYQAAKAQEAAQQQTPTVVETPTVVQTPVVTQPQETRPATPVNDNVAVRTEGLSVIDGTPLRAYSVVVGSFGLKTNAERTVRELRQNGYDARIAYNSSRDLYRVVASSFDTRNEAVVSRDRLEAQYPGAWLLYQK